MLLLEQEATPGRRLLPKLHPPVTGLSKINEGLGAPGRDGWSNSVAEAQHHEVDEEEPDDGNGPGGFGDWCDVLIVLLEFTADRQDSTSITMILVLVLILRALAR